MSQNVVNYGIDPSGAQLLDDLLSGEQQNRLTMDGGNSRPPYAEIGTIWTDKSVTGKATLKRFNGTSDDILMTIDETTGAITIPGIADTDLSNLSASGENHFSNPDLSNLSTTGKHYVAFKGYDSTTPYSLNDVVVSIQNNEVKIYQSLADNNTSSLSDTTKWKEVSLGGGAGGEIGDMGFAPLGIDESLNLRRYLNGQVISQTQFVSFTTKVKSAVALYSSLATTEANWQAEKLLSKFGQVGKFVIDDENQTIRLPAVVNAQGLLGLSGIGNLVSESLPNITGSAISSYWFEPVTGTMTGAFESDATTDGKIPSSAGASTAGRGFTFNASRSSSAYQNGAPVQQEAIQYPYYIQVATSVEETLPAIREYKVNNSDYFGKSMYSDVDPNNASLLASNGQYNARTVYPDYYDWLNGKIGQVITANGGKVVLSTGTITDYDFVVNQNDQTFRLPLLNGEEDIPGDTYENLTLQASGATYTAPANGCFSAWTPVASTDYIYVALLVHGSVDNCYASEGVSSQGFQTPATVYVKKGAQVSLRYNATPSMFRFYYAKGNGTLYYYVGDTVQDASLINAGAVLGQLANKADIDASNFNASGKSLLSGLGMPSSYTNLTLLSSGSTYTAPANGWFNAITSTSASGINVGLMAINITTGFYAGEQDDHAGYRVASFLLPVRKGDVMQFYYYGYTAMSYFRFYYAEGEN